MAKGILLGVVSRTQSQTETRIIVSQNKMKKALGDTQTLRAGCSKAEPKIFGPPQTPFPGARDGHF